MAAIMKSIHQFEHKFDGCMKHFAFHHPYISFLVMFIGMPIFMLFAVSACTACVTLPIAWVLGWV